MKKCAMAAAIAGLLLFAGTALADEQKTNDGHTNSVISGTQVQSHNMNDEQHQNMNMTTSSSSKELDHNGTIDSHGQAEEGHEMEGASGSHSHGNVEETPPNLAVLSTFGAINAAFLLYGVYTKWYRKREVAHV